MPGGCGFQQFNNSTAIFISFIIIIDVDENGLGKEEKKVSSRSMVNLISTGVIFYFLFSSSIIPDDIRDAMRSQPGFAFSP